MNIYIDSTKTASGEIDSLLQFLIVFTNEINRLDEDFEKVIHRATNN